jgi:hypothetical protein
MHSTVIWKAFVPGQSGQAKIITPIGPASDLTGPEGLRIGSS